MQRITTATKAANLFGAGKDGFKDGDLVNGVAATDLNAAWFNGVQEEILGVIEAAGLVAAAGTLNQLLTALRSAGVFSTPAQFDNTTKAATTAFVKAQGLQAAGVVLVTATSTLTAAAHVGTTVAINSASATTQTMPAANAVPAGARVEFLNINTGVGTVARAGADTFAVNNTTVTSIAVGNGDTLTLESDGVSKWYAVGGSAQLASSAKFKSSVGAPGYFTLPGGWILQMGITSVAVSSTLAVTLPIAFPTAGLLSLVAGYGTTFAAGSTPSWGSTVSTTQITLQNLYSASTASLAWLALGN